MDQLLKRPLKLTPSLMTYPWGQIGAESLIYALIKEELRSAQVPYAELWFGAHPKAPALVSASQGEVKLDELLRRLPEEILGPKVFKEFGPDLPFLFKVLSVNQALSIQAHPDKKLAALLHARDALHYPDANHKPELALALSPTQLLYGFRPPEELRRFLREVPELPRVLLRKLSETPPSAKELLDRAVKLDFRTLLASLLRQEQALVEEESKNLYQRLRKIRKLSAEEQMILALEQSYPEGDSGLFLFFLMNLIELIPGEAIFVEPNTPHCYLSGTLVECMAASDNVVRVALSSKFKDIESFISMVSCRQEKPELQRGEANKAYLRSYPVPVREFLVEMFKGTALAIERLTKSKAELVFCLEGQGQLEANTTSYSLKAGEAYLIPATVESYQLKKLSGHFFIVSVPCA